MIARIEPNQLSNRHPDDAAAVTPGSRPISLVRLKDAAHQFEASLMQEIMGPLDDAKAVDAGDPDGKDAGSDALAAFARESMAKSLSAHGGFGIADSILHYFEKSGKAK